MLICSGGAAALTIALKRAFSAAFALLKAVALFESLAFFEALLEAFAALGGVARSFATTCSARITALTHLDAAARLKPQLALGNHNLSRLQTAGDHHVFSDAGGGGHGPSLHAPVFLHDIDKLAILTVLHRRVGYGNRVWL